MLEGATFLFPWLLGALVVLPALWWLLRVLPPRPKIIKFPAFFLLKDIETKRKTAARAPWWLLLLRCLVAALFILAFAEPVLHPSARLPSAKRGDVFIVFDNGWASASHWQARIAKLDDMLEQIGRSGKPVVIIPTAPSAEDGHVHSVGPMEAEQALKWAERLAPQPWPTTPDKAAALVEKAEKAKQVGMAVFFSDGVTPDALDSQNLLKNMNVIAMDDRVNDPLILRQEDGTHYSIERLQAAKHAETVTVAAYTTAGDIADETKVVFPAGDKNTSFTWNMLAQVRDKTARLVINGANMASAVFLASAQWRQRTVGIIAPTAERQNRDFLSGAYYIRRALEPESHITVGPLADLLKRHESVLILPDSAALTMPEKEELRHWVGQGGFLIRFSGPNLAAHSDDDPLLPVPLRVGARAMEGAMTWEKPMHLSAISKQSPLYGLPPSPDTTVARQVLADPTQAVFAKTWLQLADGTPLITGSSAGKGTLVLVHTTAGPAWSNFCYSGLYVAALRRMVALSNGIAGYKAQTTLPPLSLLDGFGHLAPPDNSAIVKNIAPHDNFFPSPQTPPGLYGSALDFSAFNIGNALLHMQPLDDIPSSVTVESYHKTGGHDLKPLLLKWAILLLLADTLVTLRLRGLMVFLAFLPLLFSTPAAAAQPPPEKLASELYLAYIETGDAAVDNLSRNGLEGLANEVSLRTAAQVGGVVGVDPDKDNLAFYPVIYWPMTSAEPNLDRRAAANIQSYINQGGLILFDTSAGQFNDAGFGDNAGSTPGTRALRRLTHDIDIPALKQIGKDNILTKSFYLLQDFPGQFDSGTLWVEKEPSPLHDGVTSVVIGGNSWAAAWSQDNGDRARYLVQPGGEQQREMAYRFGINLVMVALTGNYKADQIHTPYILKRIGQ